MRERTSTRRQAGHDHGHPPLPDAEARPDAHSHELSAELITDLERAGYYPQLVADSLRTALVGEAVTGHLVHPETTFDAEEVRRHVTVLAATPTRLVVAHADDHAPEPPATDPYAVCSTECVPLSSITSVVVSQVVRRPAEHHSGDVPAEVSLTLSWGAVHRIDLEPASCADPDCEADHGYTGSMTGDDLTVRVAGAAEGADAVAAAVDFARGLSAAIVR